MKNIAIAAAVLCFAIAVGYAIGIVPWPSPGTHVKHAILFAVLGALALVWYRFSARAAAPRLR